jgi:hypothetical protein
MNGYLITNLVLGIIGVLARLCFMAGSDYPRKTTYTRGEDAFLLLVSIVFSVWALMLLNS